MNVLLIDDAGNKLLIDDVDDLLDIDSMSLEPVPAVSYIKFVTSTGLIAVIVPDENGALKIHTSIGIISFALTEDGPIRVKTQSGIYCLALYSFISST